MSYSRTTNYKLYKISQNIGIRDIDICFKDQLYENRGNKNYIINTDKAGGPGIHWVALVINGSVGYYFNPLGIKHEDYDTLKEVEEEYDELKIIDCSDTIQSLMSGWCGIYCLYFIYWMNKHGLKKPLLAVDEFHKIWNDDEKKNLTILKKRFKDIGNPNFYVR